LLIAKKPAQRQAAAMAAIQEANCLADIGQAGCTGDSLEFVGKNHLVPHDRSHRCLASEAVDRSAR
jgi:hypothetical protein